MARSLRVAIADDEVMSRVLLKEILTAAGHQVVGEAEDGRALTALVRATNPDLIITDLMMPGVNGLLALHTIYSAQSRVPTIFVSGGVGSHIENSFPDTVFLPKPFSPEELLAAIPMALDRFERSLERAQESERDTVTWDISMAYSAA